MDRILLTKESVYTYLQDTIYDISKKQDGKTRCNDGRCKETEKEVSPFALPGGDIGQLLVIASSGRRYGFEIDLEASYQVLCDIVSGEHNLGFYTDSLHYSGNNMWDGCDYMRAVYAKPNTYGLTKKDIETCLSFFQTAIKKGIFSKKAFRFMKYILILKQNLI